MAFYESTFITRQDMSEHDVKQLTDMFSNIISSGGGSIVKTEYWGLRSLAYDIKKNRKGHYVMLGVDAPYDVVKEMERRMKLSEDVLRNLTIKVEEMTSEPSVMVNSRASEEEELVEEILEIDGDE
jgi:small subunit ribosomal protein S6